MSDDRASASRSPAPPASPGGLSGSGRMVETCQGEMPSGGSVPASVGGWGSFVGHEGEPKPTGDKMPDRTGR